MFTDRGGYIGNFEELWWLGILESAMLCGSWASSKIDAVFRFDRTCYISTGQQFVGAGFEDQEPGSKSNREFNVLRYWVYLC